MKFAHFSVKEFLTGNRASTNPYYISDQNANKLIAERCLLYLLSNLNNNDIPIMELIRTFPFLQYSARYWYKHIETLSMFGIHEELNNTILRLFHRDMNTIFVNWLKVWNPDYKMNKIRGRSLRPRRLYYSALLGFVNVTEALLLERGTNVNAQGGHYGNALQAASFQGNFKVMELLLERDADVNAQGGVYGNALQTASLQENLKVVELLLERGVDVNVQCGHYGNALQAASITGNLKVTKLLLERGADVNAQGGVYGNALQAASVRGHHGVLALLRERRVRS